MVVGPLMVSAFFVWLAVWSTIISFVGIARDLEGPRIGWFFALALLGPVGVCWTLRVKPLVWRRKVCGWRS